MEEHICIGMTRRSTTSSSSAEASSAAPASVRLTAPIPRDRIFDAMAAIRLLKIKAPAEAGAILVHDLLGLGTDVLVTRDVRAR